MVGIGCPAHIMHNYVQTAADILSFDIVTIVVKIFNHFSIIYTVRTERLKEFCDFVGQNYYAILNHSKTHWLPLFPAIERILKMFEALKSFFLSEEKAPKTILNLFTESMGEIYLLFLHSQLSIFQNNIKTIITINY